MTKDRSGTAVLIAMLATALPTGAATRSSANYSVLAEVLDGGGGLAQSAGYGLTASVEPFGTGTSSSAAYLAGNGYVRQVAAFAGVVGGRWVFYNHSAWDGNDPAANANDDNAIAPDKSALLPGGTATFANYTSYSLGLNGVMIDLAVNAVPTPGDFVFKVGNNNTPASWATAPAPSSITVRYGAGAGGADRVTLIWADNPSVNAIKEEWLEVIVSATENTGLAAGDVFYFGNAIGETGNSATDAQVNSTDVNGARANPHFSINPAGIDNVYDFNRDKLVNSTDVNIARINTTFSINALKLITPVGGASPVALGPAMGAGGAGAALASVSSVAAVTRDVGLTPRPVEAGQTGNLTQSATLSQNGPELRIISSSDRQLWMEIRGPAGMVCQLEACPDLGRGDWQAVAAPAAVETGTTRWHLPMDAEQQCSYFRVMAWPAPANQAPPSAPQN